MKIGREKLFRKLYITPAGQIIKLPASRHLATEKICIKRQLIVEMIVNVLGNLFPKASFYSLIQIRRRQLAARFVLNDLCSQLSSLRPVFQIIAQQTLKPHRLLRCGYEFIFIMLPLFVKKFKTHCRYCGAWASQACAIRN